MEGKKMGMKKKLGIGIGIVLVILFLIGLFIPKSEMDERIEELEDLGYNIEEGSWNNLLSVYPEGGIDDFGFINRYVAAGRWDKFLEQLNSDYVLCKTIGIEDALSVYYDDDEGMIFFIVPGSLLKPYDSDVDYTMFIYYETGRGTS